MSTEQCDVSLLESLAGMMADLHAILPGMEPYVTTVDGNLTVQYGVEGRRVCSLSITRDAPPKRIVRVDEDVARLAAMYAINAACRYRGLSTSRSSSTWHTVAAGPQKRRANGSSATGSATTTALGGAA